MNLRQIAAAAGVSLTSVSLVLNGKPGVGPARRERITQLLLENGYVIQGRPSPGENGKTLAFVRFIRHGHLINGNPGFSTQIMDAAEAQCRRNGYSLQVITVHRTDADNTALAQLLQGDAIQGAIFLATEMGEEEYASLSLLNKPYVVLDNLSPGTNDYCITMNNRDSILEAVTTLRNLGHERIGLLESSISCFNIRHRRRAYGQALCRLGLRWDDALLYHVFPTLDGAYRSVRDMLAEGRHFPSALLASNDCIAIGAMRAFREAGLHIPGDISIIGFDGLPFSEISDPPLSTIAVPCGDIGRMAAQLLHDRLVGRIPAPVKIMVGTRLILRGSTAPPSPSEPRHPNLL